MCVATYQALRFSSDLKALHFNAVKRIVKYLVGSKEKVLIITPDMSKRLQYYVEADFVGACNKENSRDLENVLLRMGHIIKCANCSTL